MNPKILEAAEKYADEACDGDRRGTDWDMHKGVFMDGARLGIEMAAEVCDHERDEYKKSMKQFDEEGDTFMGNKEANCATTAIIIADKIRALLTDSQTGEGERG